MERKTEFMGCIIISGYLMPGFWAKCGSIYEGGYLSERAAINAVKRRIKKKLKK